MSEIERIQQLMGDDPGAPGFAALAEALRRDGRAEEAEETARAGLSRRPELCAGRVALGLALLDQGRLEEARQELERTLDRVPDHPLAQADGAAELDTPEPALPELEPEPEAVSHPFGAPPLPTPLAEPPEVELSDFEIDDAFDGARAETPAPGVDDVAADALAAVAGFDELDPEEDLTSADSPFATETVARLLEDQGAARQAAAVREAAAERQAPAGAEALGVSLGSSPARAELERWLNNLRRENR